MIYRLPCVRFVSRIIPP